ERRARSRRVQGLAPASKDRHEIAVLPSAAGRRPGHRRGGALIQAQGHALGYVAGGAPETLRHTLEVTRPGRQRSIDQEPVAIEAEWGARVSGARGARAESPRELGENAVRQPPHSVARLADASLPCKLRT